MYRAGFLDFELSLITLVIAIIALKKKKGRRQRSVWTKTWLQRRTSHGIGHMLRGLKTDPDDYRNFLRMDEELFQYLVKLVSPFIAKQDTNMRKTISLADRLAVTLRFLATYIGATTISKIVGETCDALCLSLKDYIKMPQCPEEWKVLAEDFNTRWNFPHCVGAIDGKHVSIVKPANSGSFYYNYKRDFSVVLMAVVNANYEFIMADCGVNGRVSDGGVLGYTKFGETLAAGTLGLPNNEELPNFAVKLPYVFVGDDAFSLSENLMKPYKGSKLTNHQRVYNYRCSRARGVVENAFGILAARFRIFHKPIHLSPEKVRKVVLTCCYLHNYIRKMRLQNHMPPGSVDMEFTETGETIPGSWRNEGTFVHPLDVSKSKNFPVSATSVRDSYLEYFNEIGSVPWQCKVITNY